MSKNSGQLFINKVLQTEDFNAFTRNNVTKESFVSKSDREIFEFIEQYYEKNGQTPSYATVSDNFDEFVYVPAVTDRFEALAEDIANRKIAVETNNYFETRFNKLQDETRGDMSELINTLTNDLQNIRNKYTNERSVGTDLKSGVESFMNEFNKRKEGKSFKTWKSFMSTINDEIGGYTSSNMYVLYGQSGRGKSVILLREALESAMQGATVLLWSLEMPAYEVLTRLYTMLSAVLEKTKITIDAGRRTAGFNSRDISRGQLADNHEEAFMQMLNEINEHVKGTIVIRAVDDVNFHRRNIAQLQSDIENTNADIVMIDQFYYLDYEANTSKTSGGDAAATSMKLRRLAGTMNVTIFAVTQAEEDEREGADDDVRELKVPARKAVKKTKALLEDAATLIAIDTDYSQMRGKVAINKGRNGGEGTSCELTFIPQFGVVEQLKIDENMFDF